MKKNTNNLSSVLKRILESHTKVSMEVLEYFVCQKQIINTDLLIEKFSYENCDSRYIIQGLENSATHALENKNKKINKLDLLHKAFHKSIRDMFLEYQKNNTVNEKVFLSFSKAKQNMFNYLTELIIESEGFEKKFDGLTTLYNKKYFLEKVDNEREHNIFSIVMADIDHFKHINDTYGHPTGDFILTEIANLYKKNLRKTDILGRYGGEEFIFYLKGGLKETIVVMERIRKTIENNVFIHDNQSISITSSFGIAFGDKGTNNIKSLIKKADEALYRSKKNGRNKISISLIESKIPFEIIKEEEEEV